jgi:hypothetical protein
MNTLTQPSLSSPVDKAHAHVRDAVHKASPFVEKFARFGYAAKGVVYVIVGGLAAMAAADAGGETTGSRGALNTIAEQPFGRVLLGVVAFGVLGYSMWQFIRAVEDPENEGNDRKGIGKRIMFFISGVIHLGLVFAAVQIIRGSGGGGGDDDANARGWTATLMSQPAGQWLVAGAGVGILLYGLWQVYRAFKAKLDKMLALGSLGPGTARAVRYVSRFGMGARGVVFGIIGLFLVSAAIHANPGEARGVGGALDALERQSYGPGLLGIVALGLIAYGVYEFVKARYRHIDVA